MYIIRYLLLHYCFYMKRRCDIHEMFALINVKYPFVVLLSYSFLSGYFIYKTSEFGLSNHACFYVLDFPSFMMRDS